MEDEELSTFIPLLLQLVDSFPTRSLVERSDRRMGWLELYRFLISLILFIFKKISLFSLLISLHLLKKMKR